VIHASLPRHSYGDNNTPPRRALLALGLGALVASCVQAPYRPHLPTWRQMVARGDLVQTGQDYERIKRIGQLVLRPPERGAAWQFGLDPSDRQFSVAADGNGLVLSKGMLQLCENDGQVAAILALRAEALRAVARDVALKGSHVQPEPEPSDVIVMRQLARAGYDPRDALVIAERLAIGLQGNAAESHGLRTATMKAELRRLGYQV
jgi:hypothetical protein